MVLTTHRKNARCYETNASEWSNEPSYYIKKRGISRLDEYLLTSKEALCSVEFYVEVKLCSPSIGEVNISHENTAVVVWICGGV